MMSLYHDEMPPDVDEEACPICGRPYIGRHGMCPACDDDLREERDYDYQRDQQ
ncbi:hypothetical protein [Bifidobacterium bombi]|uniref:hypothetical protein n=1 Tax=Bifidobacterium bombi TaxID=471511 RepID=UPI000A42CBD3|nr:hypothetical protein [Bifidobacterium bombi]